MKKKNYREIAEACPPELCPICDKIFQKIIVHHKDGNHENNQENNLIKICEKCHTLIHWGGNNKKLGNYDRDSFIKLAELRKYLFKKTKRKLLKNDFILKNSKPIILKGILSHDLYKLVTNRNLKFKYLIYH